MLVKPRPMTPERQGGPCSFFAGGGPQWGKGRCGNSFRRRVLSGLCGRLTQGECPLNVPSRPRLLTLALARLECGV